MKFWIIAIVSATAAGAALAAPASAPAPGGSNNATAHDPQYGDKALWAYDVTKTDHYNQKWESARVLVWSQSAAPQRGADLSESRYWLENGKPAAKGPDAGTDVVFPAGSVVGAPGGGLIEFRHVTVEAGAKVTLKDANIGGNLWIKKGGAFSKASGAFGARDKSTFCRNDNDGIQMILNMLVLNKNKECSTEWLGKWKVGDELNVFSGKFIVGPDSTFLPTDRREQKVYPNGQLILMSGATFHARGNYYGGCDLEVRGQLLAGTTNRPLTSDCTLGLSFKERSLARNPGPRGPTEGMGLILHKDGELAVNSSDPKTARLVFKWHRRENESFPLKGPEPADVAAKPHGIGMMLLGTLRLDGVVFDDVLKGGVKLGDPAARSAWRNVTYGSGNAGKPDELFAPAGNVTLDDNWGPGRGNTGAKAPKS